MWWKSKINSSLGSLVHGKVMNSNGTVDKKFENHWIFRLCRPAVCLLGLEPKRECGRVSHDGGKNIG